MLDLPYLVEMAGRRMPYGSRMEAALTGSFPVEQSAIDAGKVLTWTKGFNAKGAIGNDVVKLLQDALDRKHIHVRVSALVNDVSPVSMAAVIEGLWRSPP